MVTHEFDRFLKRLPPWGPPSDYMLYDLLRSMEQRGHGWRVVRGIDETAEADLAIAHVDATRTPEPYLAFVRSFPRTINAGVGDIAKRRVSGALLDRDAGWPGRVIVKSNLNHRRLPEIKHNALALARGWPPPHPRCWLPARYRTFASVSEVPDRFWTEDRWVVEKFVPETDPDGYAMRTWVFLGEADRSLRHVGPDELLKAHEIVRSEPVPVPEELREERRRLGFDFGKFDYVVHEGEPVLLDANRTPGTRDAVRRVIRDGTSPLPDSLEGMLA